MKLTIEQKALAACREYVRLNVMIRNLTRDIGEALSKCPGTVDAPPSDEAFQPTHLRDWYQKGDLMNEWGFMGGGIPDYKAAFEACPHCVEADKLIQQRKAARLSLGAAKRQITKLGKVAA